MMEGSGNESTAVNCGEVAPSLDKKKSVQSQLGVSLKKRRKIDSKSDLDAANYLAETYFNRVKTQLSEEGFKRFIKALCEYDESTSRNEADLYRQVRSVFESEEVLNLADEFLCFVRPQFAKEIGRYEESNALRKAWSLFNSLDSYHFNKMLSVLEWLSSEGSVKASDVESSLRPLFKTQPALVSTLCQLFPSAKPHQGDVNGYEKVLDISSEKDLEFEHVYVPRGPADRSCPGQSGCQCPCHTFNPKPLCSSCNIRFINGRIYVQRGKEFRTAKVNFSYGVSTEYMQRRLHPSYYAQLQAVVQSQPKTSPAKGERRERKQVQSEATTSKSELRNQLEPNKPITEPPPAEINSSVPSSSKATVTTKVSSWKGGWSTSSGANSQQVIYEENDEGFLEFFLEQSEPDSPEVVDLVESGEGGGGGGLVLTQSSDCDLQPTSSDELSSPSRQSPGRCNGKKSKALSKHRSKR